MTCFCWGVARKISCTSRRMSGQRAVSLGTDWQLRGRDTGRKREGDHGETTEGPRTNLIEHLVAFVEDKDPDAAQTQELSRTNALSRPGVPTMMLGWVSLLLSVSASLVMGVPP